MNLKLINHPRQVQISFFVTYTLRTYPPIKTMILKPMLHHIVYKFYREAKVIGDLSNYLGPCHVAFFYFILFKNV